MRELGGVDRSLIVGNPIEVGFQDTSAPLILHALRLSAIGTLPSTAIEIYAGHLRKSPVLYVLVTFNRNSHRSFRMALNLDRCTS